MDIKGLRGWKFEIAKASQKDSIGIEAKAPGFTSIRGPDLRYY